MLDEIAAIKLECGSNGRKISKRYQKVNWDDCGLAPFSAGDMADTISCGFPYEGKVPFPESRVGIVRVKIGKHAACQRRPPLTRHILVFEETVPNTERGGPGHHRRKLDSKLYGVAPKS